MNRLRPGDGSQSHLGENHRGQRVDESGREGRLREGRLSDPASGGDRPDVLVVGAGPAGGMAALVLARAGARVRLIDRARFPREKLCGDTVNPGALAILDGVGLGDLVRARALPVRGMIVSGPGVHTTARYPEGVAGAALARRDFDLLLVERAIAAGASFDDTLRASAPVLSVDGSRVVGVRVQSRRGEHVLAARVVIVADGRASRLASALKLARFAASPRRWAFGAYFSDVQGLTPFGEMHIRHHGYVGVAPLPGGIANVCVVRGATTGHVAPRVDQARVIADAVRGDPVMVERFERAQQVSSIMVIGPLGVDAVGAGCPGALLAGDAGGFIDPMTGDGLRFALRGGELAAEAALDELTSGLAAHHRLEDARRREFSGKWRLNRALRLFVSSPRAIDAAAAIARFWSGPIDYLARAAGDVHLVTSGRGVA